MEDSTSIIKQSNQSSFTLNEIEEKIKRLSLGSLNKTLGKKRTSKKELSYYEDMLFNNSILNQIMKEINHDIDYSIYKCKKVKADHFNETNFPSKQPQLSIEPTIKLKKKKNKNKSTNPKGNLYKENWSLMQNIVLNNEKKDKEPYYEDNFSSSDSYDSDLNPYDYLSKSNIEKRTSEIKKKKITKSNVIIEDMKSLYKIYEVISST